MQLKMETSNLLEIVQQNSALKSSDNQTITEGILVVDKPTGVSSHTVVNWARRLSGIRKIGHTGTLDPLATGLLILLVGRPFTKQQEKFLKQDKSYLATIRLGLETDSYDIQGTVVSESSWEEISEVSKEKLQEVVAGFEGTYEQKVPIFSAVKVSGKKLYEVAHVAHSDPQAKQEYFRLLKTLPSRKVTISDIQLLDFKLDDKKKTLEFDISVSCSSGTYIRSLAHDIGEKMGLGATVTALRRTAIEEIALDQALICPLFTHLQRRSE